MITFYSWRHGVLEIIIKLNQVNQVTHFLLDFPLLSLTENSSDAFVMSDNIFHIIVSSSADLLE